MLFDEILKQLSKIVDDLEILNEFMEQFMDQGDEVEEGEEEEEEEEPIVEVVDAHGNKKSLRDVVAYRRSH